jgi:dUTP diphosphatase
VTAVNIINKSGFGLPKYETTNSAGLDLRAVAETDIVIMSMQRVLIGTGLFVELPTGHEAQIRPRSGLALTYGLTVLNTPGTIDSDYRGEIKVLLINLGEDEVTVHHGDRIAQMIISKYEQVDLFEVNELGVTSRGDGGYGHTGEK